MTVNVYFAEHKADRDLARRSVASGAITMVARATTAAVQVGSLLVLARLLGPEDYGVVAMVTALLGFGPALVDLGTRDAVVQRAAISEAEVSALFWLTLGIGLTCALVISAGSPLIAAFYGEPRLSRIVMVSSLSFVALGLTHQHQALLRRALQFREMAIVDVVASVTSAAGAVLLAYAGSGYWALVMRPVGLAAITAAGTWWYCRWLPGKPVVTTAVREMTRFGANVCGFTMTDFVARNSDRVAIGRGLGSRTLGYYQTALFFYDNLLDVLVFPLHQVAVSGLSKLQHDLAALRRAWHKALSTAAFYAMPAFGVLAVTSPDLVVLLLGEKWAPAGVLLAVLSLRGIAHAAERTLGWLHVAAARTDRWMRWGVFATVVQLVALFCGIPFGPFGVAWALVLSMHLLFVPALAYAGAPLGIRARDVVAALGPQFLGTLVATGVAFLVRPALEGLPAVERMALLVVVHLLVYLALVVGVFRVTLPIQVCLSLLGRFRPGWLPAARRVDRTGA
jgi:PST family polysaccharide transporter